MVSDRPVFSTSVDIVYILDKTVIVICELFLFTDVETLTLDLSYVHVQCAMNPVIVSHSPVLL